MKFYLSPTSPYARLVAAVIIEKDLQARVERVLVNPWDSGPDILGANPVSRVPALITDEGILLTESLLIASYLDSLTPAPKLLPDAGLTAALHKTGLAQGVVDSAVYIVSTRRFGPAGVEDPLRTRRLDSIRRTLPVLARELDGATVTPDLGDLAIAITLGYLLFRLPELDWQGEHPALAAWYERVAARPSLQETRPPA